MSLESRACFRNLTSSSERVMPFPILTWSGDHSLMSYLGSLSFQLMRLSSFVQPLDDSERTAIRPHGNGYIPGE